LRSPSNWEDESVCNLLAKLAAMEVKRKGNDELVSRHDLQGSFNIKSFCNAFQDWSRCSDFPLVAIWRAKAPQNAFFFFLGILGRKSSNKGIF